MSSRRFENVKMLRLALYISNEDGVEITVWTKNYLATSSGVARVDQLPGHQVTFYKLNMKICRRDI